MISEAKFRLIFALSSFHRWSLILNRFSLKISMTILLGKLLDFWRMKKTRLKRENNCWIWFKHSYFTWPKEVAISNPCFLPSTWWIYIISNQQSSQGYFKMMGNRLVKILRTTFLASNNILQKSFSVDSLTQMPVMPKHYNKWLIMKKL